MTTTRSSIYARFTLGEITQEQAEAEARAAGFGTLERHPNPADYDPIREPFWTLPMTLAWIIYRSADPVARLMDSFQAETRIWLPTDYVGENGKTEKRLNLISPQRKSALDVINHAIKADDSLSQALSGIKARDELLRTLKSGQLQAFGIRPGESQHTSVPPITWETITTFFVDEPSIQASDIGSVDEKSARFHWVRVESARVRELWPELPSSSKATFDCRKWLVDQMRASPERRPKSKGCFRQEAMQRFPGLSKRQFDVVWLQAVEIANTPKWSRAGAPKKESNHRAS
jgi:hypothetical protein